MTDMFEEKLRQDLHRFLLARNAVDERLAECPDVDERWEETARAYLPDGMREFAGYPVASLGWMIFIGMAVAKYWDEDWAVYSQVPDLYAYMRDKRGYDRLDEYICQEVLLLSEADTAELEELTGEMASRTYNALLHHDVEPGTEEAFNAYVGCLHQLYLMGAAMQLKRMGYHMTKL